MVRGSVPPKKRGHCKSSLHKVKGWPKISGILRSSKSEFSMGVDQSDRTRLASSSHCPSTQSCNLLEFSSLDFTKEAGCGSCSTTDSTGGFSPCSNALSSYESFPEMSCSNKDSVRPALSSSISLESDETTRTDEIVLMERSPGIKHEQQFKHPQFESFTSSSEIGSEDSFAALAVDPGMETVDLPDKLSLDESCVFVDDELLHSSAARKNRSY